MSLANKFKEIKSEKISKSNFGDSYFQIMKKKLEQKKIQNNINFNNNISEPSEMFSPTTKKIAKSPLLIDKDEIEKWKLIPEKKALGN